MLLPRLVLAITVALVGVTVLLVARAQGSRRLFFMDIERDLESRDRARVTRTRAVTIVASICGMAVALMTDDPALMALLATALPFVPIGWMLGEMVALVRSLPPPHPPASFSVPMVAAPGMTRFLSVPLQIANVVVIVISAAAFWAVRVQLPAVVPLHFDGAGRPNRWGSPDELWMMFGVMLFDYALLWAITWGVSKERWALPKGEERRYWLAQSRRRSLIVRMVETLMLLVNASMAAMWLGIAISSRPGSEDAMPWAIGMSLALLTLGTIGALVGFMRPLVRVQDELRAIGGSAALGTKATGWKWGGLVYYCPEDPALFVPKQRGIGQTLNFARPGAWIFLLLVLIVPLAISVGGMLIAK